jgi:DNA-binding GntR family transcriptional regulator
VTKPSQQLPSNERVYRELKEAIISGQIPARSRLVELSLAAEYGVSRTPVREALKRLIAEELVAFDPPRGIVVKGIDQQEVEEVYTIREVLDGLAARLAAQRVTDVDLARLRSLMEVMERAAEHQEAQLMVQANIRFHQALIQAAGNERLASIQQSLIDSVRRFSAEAFRSYERDFEVLEEHRAIVDALARRDAEGAERMAREHMTKARTFLAHTTIAENLLEQAVRD